MTTPAPPAPEPGVMITLTSIYNLLLSVKTDVDTLKSGAAAVSQLAADVAAVKAELSAVKAEHGQQLQAVTSSLAKVWTSRWGAPATAIGTGLAGLITGLYGALHGG